MNNPGEQQKLQADLFANLVVVDFELLNDLIDFLLAWVLFQKLDQILF